MPFVQLAKQQTPPWLGAEMQCWQRRQLADKGCVAGKSGGDQQCGKQGNGTWNALWSLSVRNSPIALQIRILHTTLTTPNLEHQPARQPSACHVPKALLAEQSTVSHSLPPLAPPLFARLPLPTLYSAIFPLITVELVLSLSSQLCYQRPAHRRLLVNPRSGGTRHGRRTCS